MKIHIRQMNNKSNSGQAMIEALAALVILFSAFAVGSLTVLHGITRLWLEFTMREHLMCELAAGTHCGQLIKTRTQLLSWGEINDLQANTQYDHRMYKKVTGQVKWKYTKINPSKFNPNFELNFMVSEKKLRDSKW